MSECKRTLLRAFALLGPLLAAVDTEAHSPEVAPGVRVRVTYWSGAAGNNWLNRDTGTVCDIDGDRLIVVQNGVEQEFPFANLRGLEISAGHRPRVPRFFLGAGIGLVVGATMGGLIGSIPGSSSGGLGSEGANTIGVAYTATLGALLGGIIGAATGGDTWQPVEVPSGSRSPSLR